MTARRVSTRAIALPLALALAAGLSAPAHAIEPYPGETREAFVARAALEQQRKLAEADAAAGATPGFAGGGSTSGGGFRLGAIGLAMLALGGLRMSRGIFRVSRAVTKTSSAARAGESFEDRLAEKLRELERDNPAPAVQAAPPAPAPRPLAAPGQRTFGRRIS